MGAAETAEQWGPGSIPVQESVSQVRAQLEPGVQQAGMEGTLAGPALGLEGWGTLEESRGPKLLTPRAPVLLWGPVMMWDSRGGHATAWGWHRALDPAEGSNRANGAWWGLWLRLWGEGLGEVSRSLGLSRGAQGRGQAWPTLGPGVLVGSRRGVPRTVPGSRLLSGRTGCSGQA